MNELLEQLIRSRLTLHSAWSIHKAYSGMAQRMPWDAASQAGAPHYQGAAAAEALVGVSSEFLSAAPLSTPPSPAAGQQCGPGHLGRIPIWPAAAQQGMGHPAAPSSTAVCVSPCRAQQVGTCGCSAGCPAPSELTHMRCGAMGRRGYWLRLHLAAGPALHSKICSAACSLERPACATSLLEEPPLQVGRGQPTRLSPSAGACCPHQQACSAHTCTGRMCNACMFPAAYMQSDAPGLPWFPA